MREWKFKNELWANNKFCKYKESNYLIQTIHFVNEAIEFHGILNCFGYCLGEYNKNNLFIRLCMRNIGRFYINRDIVNSPEVLLHVWAVGKYMQTHYQITHNILMLLVCFVWGEKWHWDMPVMLVVERRYFGHPIESVLCC